MFEERKDLIRKVEGLRGGRKLICFLNFDRVSHPKIPDLGLDISFDAEAKEAFFRVLKETGSQRFDVCIYTRGGDANGVWPLVSIIREFDPDFEVLVPFRCHSSGTLFALGARKIVLTPLSELSPIDPSTGNQFNPLDESDKKNRLAISVEDVRAYRSFILEQFGADESHAAQYLAPYLTRLTEAVHPLALGNVDRVHRQIKQLARNLLNLHPVPGRDCDKVIEALTMKFWSHLHMVNRHEAREILSEEHVVFADQPLASALDDLLRAYEDTFHLRRTFFLAQFGADEPQKDVRFIGGVLESEIWSYLHETKAVIRQHPVLPNGVQLQLPAGQPLPMIPGLSRNYQVDVSSRGWVRNKAPIGFDR